MPGSCNSLVVAQRCPWLAGWLPAGEGVPDQVSTSASCRSRNRSRSLAAQGPRTRSPIDYRCHEIILRDGLVIWLTLKFSYSRPEDVM